MSGPAPRGRMSLLALVSALALCLGLASCSDDEPAVTVPTKVATTPAASATTSATPSVSTPPMATSPASKAAPGSPSNLVALCGTTGLSSPASQSCKAMQKNFSTSTLYCSAVLPSSVTGKVDVTVYRNGSQVHSASTTRPNGTQSLYMQFSVGQLKLPSGAYACTFKAGSKTWTGTTTLTGPTGQATQTMACDGTTMFRSGSVAHCKTGSATLARPGSVGCSSLVTDAQGKEVAVLVGTPKGPKSASAGRLGNGAAVVQVAADKAAFGGEIPTGAYSCTFVVDGKQVSKVGFSVTG